MATGTGDDEELDLKVPAAPLLEDFGCPICVRSAGEVARPSIASPSPARPAPPLVLPTRLTLLRAATFIDLMSILQFDTVTDCRMTHCGHNYCSSCIEEWLTRSTHCPVCSGTISMGGLVKNTAFDTLLHKIRSLKEASRKEYFARLAAGKPRHSASDGTPSSGSVGAETAGLSAVETVFQRHMQRSLAQFTHYEKLACEALGRRRVEVQVAFGERMDKLRAVHTTRLRRLASDGLPPAPAELARSRSQAEADEALALAVKQRDEKLAVMQAEFDNSIGLLLANYDKYLAAAAPPPSLLPATVRIKVPSHNLEFMAQVLCTHTVRDLQDLLIHEAQQLGNPVRSFGADSTWSVVGAGRAASAAEGAGAGPGAGAGAGSGGGDDPHHFEAGTKTLFEQCVGGCLPPGAVIRHTGTLVCKNDEPVVCLTADASFAKGQKVDYSTCVTCGINWVCEACKIPCHVAKGHQVKPHFQGHPAAFACCYCAKKKKCCIKNNRTKKK